MTRDLREPFKKPKKIRVARGSMSLWPPVAFGGDVYVGYADQELLKLDRNLEPVWRIPSNGFDVKAGAGHVVVQEDHRNRDLRAVRPSGEVAWTRHLTGWIWRDKILVVQTSKVVLVDAGTGDALEEINFGAAIAGGSQGDVFLFRRLDAPEEECAFDLMERRLLWKRNVLQAMETRFAVWSERREFGSVLGSSGRLVGIYAEHIFGLSMEDGSPLWCVPGFVPYGVPLVQGGRVYAWTCDKEADYGGHLLCIDEASGEVVYDRLLKEYGPEIDVGANMNPGAVFGDYLVYTTRTGRLVVFRQSDGDGWSWKYPHELHRPVVAENRVLVTADDGNLLAFEGRL